MPANPWQLRADLRALDRAADSWTGIARTVASRADELVDAARRAIDGWDAEAAESYDAHRRQVLTHLDRFTALADSMAGALRTVSAALSSSQDELDRSWSTVALVPHREVGESRHLVFEADDDEKRSKVDRGQAQAQEIRGRLSVALAQEDARIRSLREELALVRADVTELAGGAFGSAGSGGSMSGGGTAHAVDPGGSVEGTHGLSALSSASEGSTSVVGSAQTGRALGLPPIAPISVSVADLGGLPSTGLGGVGGAAVAAVAAGLAGRQARRRTDERSAAPPMGGMAAGAMGARAGSAGRPTGSGGAAGGRRMPTPRLEGGAAADDEAREKDAVREAKREALAEKRAERAARKAEREAQREAECEARQEAGEEGVELAGGQAGEQDGSRPAALTVVEVAPGDETEEPRR